MMLDRLHSRPVAAPLMSKVKAEDGKIGSHLKDRRANGVVCGDGSSPKTKRKSPNMCRLNKTQ